MSHKECVKERTRKKFALFLLTILLGSTLLSYAGPFLVFGDSDVTILASGESDPQGIAVSGGFVYWAEYRGDNIKRVSTDGGPVTTLTYAGWPFTNVVVDGGYVYWGGNGPGIRGREYVARVPISGGTIEKLATARYPFSIAVYQGRVYWCDFVSGNICDVKSVSTSGGTVQTLATGQGYPQDIMAADGYIYWTELTTGNIRKMPASGGSVETIVAGPGADANLYYPHLSNGYIYWAVNQRAPFGEIKRVSVNGGAVQTLATGEDNPFAVFVDGGYVYWTTGAWYSTPPGTIKRVPVDGGTVETLQSSLTNPQRLAVSSGYVYWTEGGEHNPGFVKKTSLPGGKEPPKRPSSEERMYPDFPWLKEGAYAKYYIEHSREGEGYWWWKTLWASGNAANITSSWAGGKGYTHLTTDILDRIKIVAINDYGTYFADPSVKVGDSWSVVGGTLRVDRKERLDTPIGTFNTFVVVMESGLGTTTVWFEENTGILLKEVMDTFIAKIETIIEETNIQFEAYQKPITREKQASTVFIEVTSQVPLGESLQVIGSLFPALSATVKLIYSAPDGTIHTRTVTSDQDGNFKDIFKPEKEGTWQVKASWPGNEKYKPSESQAISFTVKKIPPAMKGPSGDELIINWLLKMVSVRTEETKVSMNLHYYKVWKKYFYEPAWHGMIQGKKPDIEISKDGEYQISFSVWKVTKETKFVIVSIPKFFQVYNPPSGWIDQGKEQSITVYQTSVHPYPFDLVGTNEWILFPRNPVNYQPNPVDYIDLLRYLGERESSIRVTQIQVPMLDEDAENSYYVIPIEPATYLSGTDYFSIIVRPTELKEGLVDVLIGKPSSSEVINDLTDFLSLLKTGYDAALGKFSISRVYGAFKFVLNSLDSTEHDFIRVKVLSTIEPKTSTGVLTKDEVTIQSLDFSNIQGDVTISLDWPGSDLDLHLYDHKSKHVGLNYDTGKVELNIEGVTYSGPTAKPEWIKVSKSAAGKYTLLVVAKDTPSYGEMYTLETVRAEAATPEPFGTWVFPAILSVIIVAVVAGVALKVRSRRKTQILVSFLTRDFK